MDSIPINETLRGLLAGDKQLAILSMPDDPAQPASEDNVMVHVVYVIPTGASLDEPMVRKQGYMAEFTDMTMAVFFGKVLWLVKSAVYQPTTNLGLVVRQSAGDGA